MRDVPFFASGFTIGQKSESKDGPHFDEPIILFSLGGRRFAIRCIVSELDRSPAEVIPIQKQRQRKSRWRCGGRWR